MFADSKWTRAFQLKKFKFIASVWKSVSSFPISLPKVRVTIRQRGRKHALTLLLVRPVMKNQWSGLGEATDEESGIQAWGGHWWRSSDLELVVLSLGVLQSHLGDSENTGAPQLIIWSHLSKSSVSKKYPELKTHGLHLTPAAYTLA